MPWNVKPMAGEAVKWNTGFVSAGSVTFADGVLRTLAAAESIGLAEEES
jgi:hypothetical protein